MNRVFQELAVCYFQLQWRRVNRQLRDWGLLPAVFYPVVLALFAFVSWQLMHRGVFAQSAYLFAGLAIAHAAGIQADWLRAALRRRDYYLLMLVQSFILLIPFFLFILIAGNGYLVLPAIAIIPILHRLRGQLRVSILKSTIFSSRPYEFAVGIRRFVIPVLGIYLTIPLAWIVDNSNFLLPGWAALVLLGVQFYQNPDPEFYVWSFKGGPNAFLKLKLRTALIQMSVLVAPLLVAFLVAAPERWLLALLFLVGTALYISAGVLVRYVCHPHKMDFYTSLLLALSMVMPPFLLFTLPVFYTRSRRALNRYLND